jgi:methylenetetrahydrofolate reductase (NADPH)
MKPASKLAGKIEGGDFIITAEYLPRAGTDMATIDSFVSALSQGPVAVNVADNHYGIGASSLAASVALSRVGIEPIYQIVTRDRNRIALQSDLLGAALLDIKNVLCLSGYHQTLMGSPQATNVYDIDSIQLVATVKKMNEEGSLLDGTKIEGKFSMLIGAAANPYTRPIELNVLRVSKKVEAGAVFIQTQAVFDIESLQQWVEALRQEGITERVAILAGVLPLANADEARRLSDTFTDFYIPEAIIERIKAVGDLDAQKKEGLAISAEIIRKVKDIKGLRGVHIFSGGNEAVVPEIMAMVTQ